MTNATSMKGFREQESAAKQEPARQLDNLQHHHEDLTAELTALQQQLNRNKKRKRTSSTELRQLRQSIRDFAASIVDLRHQIAALGTLVEAQNRVLTQGDRDIPETTESVTQPAPPLIRRLRGFLGHAIRVLKKAAWDALDRKRSDQDLEVRLLPVAARSRPTLTLIIPTNLSSSLRNRIERALDQQSDQLFERASDDPLEKIATDFVGRLPPQASGLLPTAVETLRLLLATERLSFTVASVGTGFLTVVRTDLCVPGTAEISAEALTTRAKSSNRLVLGKSIRPLAVSHPFPPITALAECRRRGVLAWSGPYAICSRARSPQFHEVAEAGPNLASSAPSDPPEATLVIVAASSSGGLERIVYQLVRELKDSRRVVVVAIGPADELSRRRLDLLSHHTPWVYDWAETFAPPLLDSLVAWLIKRHQITSAVSAWGPGPFPIGNLRTSASQLHWVGIPLPGAKPPLGGWNSLDRILAVTRDLHHRIAAEVGECVTRLPATSSQGVSDQQPRIEDAGLHETRAKDLDDTNDGAPKICVTMHADLVPDKRPEDFLALAHRLRSDHRFEFLLVGTGPLASTVEDLSLILEVPRFRWRTTVPDLDRLIEQTDIACSTAESDPFPYFIQGALAAGKLAVAANIDDLGDLLRHESFGALVDRPGDIDAFAAALVSLSDSEVRSRTNQSAREVQARSSFVEALRL